MSTPCRSSLVISQPKPGEAVQQGDDGFETELLRHYNEAETLALEKLYQFKNTLGRASNDEFWFTFCDGLARICDAQYAVVSKRLDDSAPVGEHGSCLMALCWFYDNGHGVHGTASNITYHAFSCPCALMSHRKVLLIPERLNETFPESNNPNKMAFPAEAYLAIPLFDGDKCVAHFGILWTPEALQRRKLGWGFLEMLCHALEDIVLQRFLAGAVFPKQDGPSPNAATIPFETIAALHSLKPFARNLSHELRTPMQGIVGMLDIMYATIADAVRSQTTAQSALVFEELKDSLEVIQASAKRAIEASDNVVEAYALNMGLPELALPTPPVDVPYVREVTLPISNRNPTRTPPPVLFATSPALVSLSVPRDNFPPRGVKRHRDQPEDYDDDTKAKRTSLDGASENPRTQHFEPTIHSGEVINRSDRYSPSLLFSSTPGLQYINLRDVINFVVHESLKTNGISSAGTPTTTAHGEKVDVKATLGNGSVRSKTVEWVVHPTVPEFILVDERMLAKMLSCVFQNALKFTESGLVKIVARFCQKRELVLISVKDTGPGIPEHFRKRIFKPFAREDDSTTRQNEGLGLGLLVAKGLSQKLGGDVILVSSDTSGDNKGCEFEMRIPASPNRAIKPPESPGIATLGNESPPRISSVPSTAPQLHLSPSTPSSASSTQAFSKPPTNYETVTEPEITSTLRFPHSPPQSPGCPTCSFSENNACPSVLLEQSPQTQSLQLVAESNQPSSTATPLFSPPVPSPPAVRIPKVVRRTSQLFDRNLAASHPLTFLVAEDNPVNRKLLVSMLTKLGYDPNTQIYEAYDGAEAVRKVQAATQQFAEGESRVKGPIDVVLMDLWMPAMDGYEATERILGMFRPRKPSTWRTMSAPDGLSISTLGDAHVPSSIAETEAAGVEEVKRGSGHSDGIAAEDEGDEQQQCHARAWRTTLRAREVLPPTILAVTADATEGAFEKAKSAGMEGFMIKPFRVRDLEKLIREGWTRRERGLEAKKVDIMA